MRCRAAVAVAATGADRFQLSTLKQRPPAGAAFFVSVPPTANDASACGDRGKIRSFGRVL